MSSSAGETGEHRELGGVDPGRRRPAQPVPDVPVELHAVVRHERMARRHRGEETGGRGVAPPPLEDAPVRHPGDQAERLGRGVPRVAAPPHFLELGERPGLEVEEDRSPSPVSEEGHDLALAGGELSTHRLRNDALGGVDLQAVAHQVEADVQRREVRQELGGPHSSNSSRRPGPALGGPGAGAAAASPAGAPGAVVT